MHRYRKELGSGVRQQSAALAQALQLQLLLVSSLLSSVFLHNFVLHTDKAIQGDNQTKRGLPSTWSNYFRMLYRQVPSLLHMRRLLSKKYSKERERLTVPKSKQAK